MLEYVCIQIIEDLHDITPRFREVKGRRRIEPEFGNRLKEFPQLLLVSRTFHILLKDQSSACKLHPHPCKTSRYADVKVFKFPGV